MNDARNYRRVNTDLITHVTQHRVPPGMAEPFKATLADVSFGGVFLETPHPPEVDTMLDITLQVPGTDQTAVLKGMVVWSERGKGAGIELVGVTTSGQSVITAIMKHGETERSE